MSKRVYNYHIVQLEVCKLYVLMERYFFSNKMKEVYVILMKTTLPN